MITHIIYYSAWTSSPVGSNSHLLKIIIPVYMWHCMCARLISKVTVHSKNTNIRTVCGLNPTSHTWASYIYLKKKISSSGRVMNTLPLLERVNFISPVSYLCVGMNCGFIQCKAALNLYSHCKLFLKIGNRKLCQMLILRKRI